MTVSDRDLEWITGQILAREQPEAIYLFGSQAKGTAGRHSDVDLLVVAPSSLPRSHRGKHHRSALASFSRRFDILCYTPEELAEECSQPGSFLATILRTARRLYPE
ncbi:MAG TPA: nucleotidyltransferase domain-containing protein [Solirubrobacterales bacterium]|nr:nucleotidyltransferase domain-containing protein [Solirubrobacterales bacterium]